MSDISYTPFVLQTTHRRSKTHDIVDAWQVGYHNYGVIKPYHQVISEMPPIIRTIYDTIEYRDELFFELTFNQLNTQRLTITPEMIYYREDGDSLLRALTNSHGILGIGFLSEKHADKFSEFLESQRAYIILKTK